MTMEELEASVAKPKKKKKKPTDEQESASPRYDTAE